MTKQIRFKLTLMFILLITIPLTVLGGVSYSKSKEILKKNLQNSTLQLVKQTEKTITNYLYGFEKSLVEMSYNEKLQNIELNKENLVKLKKDFSNFLKSHEHVLDIYMGTENKKMYSLMYDEFEENFDASERPWYKEAKNQNKFVWTKPYLDKDTNKLIVSGALPLLDKLNNKFIGVIALDITLQELGKEINAIEIGKKGYVFILDETDKIIIHPNQTFFLKPLENETIIKALKENNEGNVEYIQEEQGSKKYKFAVFTKNKNLGWSILATTYINEINDDTSILLKRIISIGMIFLLGAIFISILFSKTITKPIHSLLRTIEKVKNGNFSVRSNLKSKDELGKLGEGFNVMLESVGCLINSIKSVANEVKESSQILATTSTETSISSKEINTAVEEIAKGASEQANDAEKGAALTCSLSEKFNELEDNIKIAEDATIEVTKLNIEGTKVVDDLDIKANYNEEAIEKIGSAINELNNNVMSIQSILDTINSISDQTNLLALNASIEASKAGEAGKGFAVVAEEIRKLAEESKNSANDIKQVITKIQEESNTTVNMMNEVKTRTKNQTYAVKKVNESFNGISKSVKDIILKINHISNFVKEIHEYKESIVSSINNISSISQEAAAGAEQVTASIIQQSYVVQEVANSGEKLSELANKMDSELNKFKV
jgi:methyl-accepting chemotaxis protein